jgi:anti-sigma factor RsiW
VRDCADVEIRLDAFVDSELSAAEQVDVARHLAGCDACNAAVDRMLTVRDGLVAMTRSAMSTVSLASVVPAVMHRTAHQPVAWRARRRVVGSARAWATGFAIAAGVVLAFQGLIPTTVAPPVRVANRMSRPAVIERVVGNVDVRHDRKNGAPMILVNYSGSDVAR